MAKVKYSKTAAVDLFEHAEFIAQGLPDAAYRWVETIEKVCCASTVTTVYCFVD